MSAKDSTTTKKRKQAERPILVPCQNCGKEFPVQPCKLLRGNGKFCSKSCRYAYIIPVPPPEERFWDKVKKTDTCWIWTASKRTPSPCGGYGKFAVGRHRNQKNYMAHRFSWILHHGPIPDGLCVLHHCDNRLCVNPAHLFLGTRRDNADDMLNKERSAKGEKHPHSILSEAMVRQIKAAIRNRYGSLASVARKFNITYVTLQAIHHGRNWKHI